MPAFTARKRSRSASYEILSANRKPPYVFAFGVSFRGGPAAKGCDVPPGPGVCAGAGTLRRTAKDTTKNCQLMNISKDKLGLFRSAGFIVTRQCPVYTTRRTVCWQR